MSTTPWPTPIEALLSEAAAAADMLEELGADHTASNLRQFIDRARADVVAFVASRMNAGISGLQKEMLLKAADRFVSAFEHTIVPDAKTNMDDDLDALRIARAWLERQPVKP